MAIRKSFIRGINMLLAALLALFGFSNCDTGVVEYGVPNADYTVKGIVVDKADAKPIKGIRIGFSPSYSGPILMYGVIPTPYRRIAADTTDVNGAYKVSDNFSIGEIQDNILPVYVQDIDGTENGLYNDTILNIDVENAKRIGKAKNWYDGEYTLDVNIELTRKKEGNE
jgi:putative lipoprotein (rSAM/lipoprotein system)